MRKSEIVERLSHLMEKVDKLDNQINCPILFESQLSKKISELENIKPDVKELQQRIELLEKYLQIKYKYDWKESEVVFMGRPAGRWKLNERYEPIKECTKCNQEIAEKKS